MYRTCCHIFALARARAEGILGAARAPFGRGGIAALLALGLLGLGPATAQQAPSLQERMPDRLEERVQEHRARIQEGASATSGLLSKSHRTRVQSAQSWALTQNPDARLNFSILGTPQYAGDVDGDGTNDYLYSAFARDERTASNLEDRTGKTALFFGGTPSQTSEDQFLYERLHPAGDLNGDGFDDAIAEQMNGNEYRIYTGSSSGYQDSTTTITGFGRPIRGFADLDGDGYEDVLLGGDDGTAFQVLFGGASLDSLEVREYTQSRSGGQYAVGDLDGDGQASIARTAFSSDGRLVQVYAVDSSRALAQTQQFELPSEIDHLSLIDVTGNGQQEIAALRSDRADIFSADSNGVYQGPPATVTKREVLPVGDLDGDGNHDFHVTDSTGTRYVAYGPDDLSQGLKFGTEISFADGETGGLNFLPSGGFGDVTGDGRADVILYYENRSNDQTGRRFFSVNSDGTARETTDATYAIGRFYDSIDETNEIGDFNGDGTTDFAVVRDDLGEVNIFYGGSTISSTPDLTITPPTDTADVANVSSGDFDGDGNADLLVGGFGDRIDIYFGGDGAAEGDATVDHSILASDVGFPLHLPRAIGDINGDGATDWLASDRGENEEYNVSGQNVAIFLGGSPLPTTASETMQYPDGNNIAEVKTGVGDVNGNGYDDFAFSNSDQQQVDVYFGEENPSYSTPADLALPISRYPGLAAGDFNGDGTSDIAAMPYFIYDGGYQTLEISIFYGGTNVDATADQRLRIPAVAGPDGDLDDDGWVEWSVGVLESPGDVDGDGADDLIHGSSFFGLSTNALLYRPNVESTPSLVFQAPNQDAALGSQQFIYSAAMGDFTGNGTIDFVPTQFNDNNDAARSSRVYRFPVKTEAFPPEAPAGLQATARPTQGEVQLAWDSVEAGDLAGYNVYRAQQSFADSDDATKLNSTPLSDTSFTDTGVQLDASYYYRVTAADADGNESNFSNEAVASLPAAVTALADEYTIRAGSTLTVPAPGVLGNDSAVEDSLTAALADSASSGTVTLNADGSFDYTPDSSAAGTDRFTYAAVDTNSVADTAQVTIEVTPSGGTVGFTRAGAELRDTREGSVTWTDVDQDGDPDLLIVGPGETTLYENDGTGELSPMNAGLRGFAESSSDAADIDGDNDPDLVITGYRDAVLYENDGTGQFTEVGANLAGVRSGASTFGDFDRDGDPDLVITGSGKTVIYQNDGSGGFSALNAGLMGLEESSADWGDVDGDGDLDLVVTGETENFTPTTILYENQGGGTFAEMSVGLPDVRLGAAKFADLGNDGDADLVLTGRSESQGRIARVYENDGTGSFTDLNAGLDGVSSGSVEWSDLDRDGNPDLIVTGYSPATGSPSATLYRNDGQGTFTKLDAGLKGVYSGASAAADADEDGDTDVVIAGNEGGVVEATRFYVNRQVQKGPNRSPRLPEVPAPDTLAAGLSLDEIIEAGDPNGDSLSLQLTQSAANTSFTDRGNGTADFSFAPDRSQLGQTAQFGISVTDGNGGSANASFDVSVPDRFAALDAQIQEFDFGSANWVDFDGDGDDDLFVSGQGTATLYESDGQGNLTPVNAGFEGVGFGSASDWGDFDDDGDPDLILTGNSSSGASATIYENQGGGTFTTLGANLTGVNRSAVHWLDADGDSDLDLFVAGEDESGNRVTTLYENQGGGSFAAMSAGLTAVNDASVDVGDLGGDGDPDLIVTGESSSGDTAIIYENDGSGNFTALGAGLAGVERGSSDFGDFDGDGDLDVLVTGSVTTTVYENEGGGTFTPMNENLVDLNYASSDVGDVDGDGDLDLLLSGRKVDPGEPITRIYENDGNGNFSVFGAGFRGAAVGAAAFGNLDGEGNPDVVEIGNSVLTENPKSAVYENLMEGGTTVTAQADGYTTIAGEVLSVPAPGVLGNDSGPSGDSLTASVMSDVSSGTLSLNGDGSFTYTADSSFTGTDTFTYAASAGGTSDSATVTIEVQSGVARTLSVTDGWNLASIPVQAPDPQLGSVLPSCRSGFYFETGEGYAPIPDGEPVTPGRGFWAKCTGDTVSVAGTRPDSSVINVEAGWNVVGPFADTVDVASIASTPSGIVVTGFSAFDNSSGYQSADSLRPGHGYWVKVSESGTLDLSGTKTATVPVLADERTASDNEETSTTVRLSVTDAEGRSSTLTLGRELSEAQMKRSALPPKPPSGLFDVRFGTGQSTAAFGEDSDDPLRSVELQGAAAPVTLRLDNATKGQVVRLQTGADGAPKRLTAEAPSTTLQKTNGPLEVGLRSVPTEFALKKHAPNPTSGRTQIRFAVPEQTEVTVEVYDVLGRRVARLVNGAKKAGTHTTVLDAGRLSSGTYFYRMRAGDFTETRRMVVIE